MEMTRYRIEVIKFDPEAHPEQPKTSEEFWQLSKKNLFKLPATEIIYYSPSELAQPKKMGFNAGTGMPVYNTPKGNSDKLVKEKAKEEIDYWNYIPCGQFRIRGIFKETLSIVSEIKI